MLNLIATVLGKDPVDAAALLGGLFAPPSSTAWSRPVPDRRS